MASDARDEGDGKKAPHTRKEKKAGRGNAVKHGLTSTLLLPGLESSQELTKLHRSYKRSYSPRGPAERQFVRMLAAAAWQMQRGERFERAELLHRNADEESGSKAHGGPELRIPDETAYPTDLILRYQSFHLRKYLRVLQALNELRKARGAPPVGKAKPKKRTD